MTESTVFDPGPSAASSSGLDARMGRVTEILSAEGALPGALVTRPHPLLVLVAREESTIAVAPAVVWDKDRDLFQPLAAKLATGRSMVILLGRPLAEDVSQALRRGLSSILPEEPSAEELLLAVTRTLELLESRMHAESRGASLDRYRVELAELVHIARALTTERDVSKLLGVILEKSRFITGADAGSIYVVEDGSRPGNTAAHASDKSAVLRFKLTQNDSVTFDSREFVMPISNRSIAGSAALTKKAVNLDDVYQVPPGSPFHFDRSFDEKIGYVTKSMLTMPLISQRDEVIGVIQLINKKKDPQQKVTTRADVEAHVIPFDQRSEELLGMLAAQAGVALENALLYDEIQRLFAGFVRASVEAIESRDPTTSGHSRRVADLTVNLAKVVDAMGDGPYREASFSREDLRELEYASLLHDFGKIGVREKVLVKAKKLFDERLELIRARFDFVERTIETDVLTRKLRAIERGAPASELEALDRELNERRAELVSSFQSILNANEPTVLASGDFEKIEQLARETYTDLRGEVRRLLEDEEVVSLSVKRGSLTPEEFDEIRSHVSHTFKFLSQIPWGKAFRRVPVIAGAHHERLNGTGYPNRLHAEEIPLQSKMMSIADIYDALTASDRPYKKAVPLDRALDILEFSVKDGHLDSELVRVFREARIWEQCDAAPTSMFLR